MNKGKTEDDFSRGGDGSDNQKLPPNDDVDEDIPSLQEKKSNNDEKESTSNRRQRRSNPTIDNDSEGEGDDDVSDEDSGEFPGAVQVPGRGQNRRSAVQQSGDDDEEEEEGEDANADDNDQQGQQQSDPEEQRESIVLEANLVTEDETSQSLAQRVQELEARLQAKEDQESLAPIVATSAVPIDSERNTPRIVVCIIVGLLVLVAVIVPSVILSQRNNGKGDESNTPMSQSPSDDSQTPAPLEVAVPGVPTIMSPVQSPVPMVNPGPTPGSGSQPNIPTAQQPVTSPKTNSPALPPSPPPIPGSPPAQSPTLPTSTNPPTLRPSPSPVTAPDSPPTKSPTNQPSPSPADDGLLLLIESLVYPNAANIWSISATTTQALEWLLEDALANSLPLGTAAEQTILVERFVAAKMYFALAGPTQWVQNQGWLSNNLHICDWAGLECNNVQRVTSFFAENNNLVGTLATEFGLLEMLTYVNMGNNRIGGTLPREIGKLTNLENFAIWENALTGPMPTEIGRLSVLSYFDVDENCLTGTFPTELGNLVSIEDLYIRTNHLRGNLNAIFCDSGGPLPYIAADCQRDDVICDCCAICCDDQQCVGDTVFGPGLPSCWN